MTDANALLAIAALAATCFATRAAGYWGAAWIPAESSLRRLIEALPGPLLTALVVTAAVSQGVAASLAMAVTLLAMWLTKSELGAAALGVLALGLFGSIQW